MDSGRSRRGLVALALAAGLVAGCGAPAPPAPAAPAAVGSDSDHTVGKPNCPPMIPGVTPLKGAVLAADNKAGVFLLDRGQRDGIKVGDELTVYRADSFVAVVVVDRVSEENCAVSVKVENGTPLLKAGMQVRRGDQVATVY